MEKEIFDKELAICRQFNKVNGGKCNWGECDKCGVIPLLYKLGEGRFYEDPNDVSELRKTILQ